MTINITGNNLELTPALKEYIETHLSTLDKFFTKIDNETVKFHVIVSRTTRHHIHGDVYQAEINLTIPHKSFQAKSDGEDIRVVFDAAKNKLKQEIIDSKEKDQDKR